MAAVIILSILLPMMMAAAFLLGRHLQGRQARGERLSPVSREHVELFQGGHLNEAAVEAAKARFQDLLERGEVATVEASLRPGMHYVVAVRALAEIGTDVAGRILERQLHRRLSDDQLEQSWYWIDLASSLRSLNRQESLPHLLRCADQAGDIPLGHFFAAETVCFLGFGGYLQQPDTPQGRAAMLLLHRALEGLRYGVQPLLVLESRLGEILESLWDHRPAGICPLLVRIAHETLRLLRRAEHLRAVLGPERTDQEAFDWQMSRLSSLEPALEDYLQEAPAWLRSQLARAQGENLDLLLQALNDLRVDAGREILDLLSRDDVEALDQAVEVLQWSRHPHVGPWLRGWLFRQVPMQRRATWRRRALAPRRSSLPDEIPYAAGLRALRGHASLETEAFLMLAARDYDPTYRVAAYNSLGWWEPLRRAEALQCLQTGRRDPNAEVRQAARAALGRLGERQALHWFRQALTGEDTQQVHEAVQVVAAEGLMLLWPDLDRLADSDNPDIALHAREALERLCEEMAYKPL